LKNGALLTAAEEAGYELFITADQEITCQQNLTGRKMALLVLRRITGIWSKGVSRKSAPQSRR
jgi:glutathione synthase/RimK-type ligase-like ATP-grasp enzyme